MVDMPHPFPGNSGKCPVRVYRMGFGDVLQQWQVVEAVAIEA